MDLLYLPIVICLTWLAVVTDRRDRVLVPRVNGTRLGKFRVMKLSSWANKRVGLTNHAQLPHSCGVFIERSRGIHTKGMVFPIDVVVLNRDMEVETVVRGLRPGKVLNFKAVKHVLELGPGVAEYWGLTSGAKVELTDA